jgi:hypothetical protein
LTVPAIWIAPPNSSSFSVSVVLPASGCEMIAKVRRRGTGWRRSGAGLGAAELEVAFLEQALVVDLEGVGEQRRGKP